MSGCLGYIKESTVLRLWIVLSSVSDLQYVGVGISLRLTTDAHPFTPTHTNSDVVAQTINIRRDMHLRRLHTHTVLFMENTATL